MATKSDICDITLHFPHAGRPPVAMANERNTAVKDLIQTSQFQPLNDKNGPYSIDLSIEKKQLIFKMVNATLDTLPLLVLSLGPYRRLIKDYFLMIESYEKARMEGVHSKLESIDMGRRGIHNEAAELMIDRLKDKIALDLDTARRLFTLICVLHIDQARLWR